MRKLLLPAPALAVLGAALLAGAVPMAGPALAQAPVMNLTPAGEDVVVGRVNGIDIRRSEVTAVVETLPEQYRQLPGNYLFDLVLTQLIDRKLMAAAAETAKLGDDPEVKQRIAMARETALQEAWLGREIEKGVTEEKMRERYKKMLAEQPAEEEIRARHILVESEEAAKGLIVELKKGTDFAALAKSKSTGPSANNGGDLGFFKREDMVPEFTEAAFKLKAGEYTDTPVKSQFGWHVIKLEERRKAPPPDYEASKETLRREVTRDVVVALVEKLRAGAKVEQFDAQGNAKPEAPAKK
ncbi:peptidylprolyl isomerase [Desertibaculum subflavum]|uniref:peptidylprolyl isomerase n=1 Tax=Desertibaculum subflavum TaxID=2268458 RepID=UPI000E672D13